MDRAKDNKKRKEAPDRDSNEDATKKKPEISVETSEKEVNYEEAASVVRSILESKTAPAPDITRWRFKVKLPNSYGKDCHLHVSQHNHHHSEIPENVRLSPACKNFLQEVGWIARHLMFGPYTKYRVITECNIRQCLKTLMHPKHWRMEEYLYKIIPGMYFTKNCMFMALQSQLTTG